MTWSSWAFSLIKKGPEKSTGLQIQSHAIYVQMYKNMVNELDFGTVIQLHKSTLCGSRSSRSSHGCFCTQSKITWMKNQNPPLICRSGRSIFYASAMSRIRIVTEVGVWELKKACLYQPEMSNMCPAKSRLYKSPSMSSDMSDFLHHTTATCCNCISGGKYFHYEYS